MLHGFGLYPVSLQIDIDSYDGDWRHVARFRNRSGWLAVAQAEIWTGNELCATLPIIVGCDEHENEIPAFIAANLLGCATSYPEPCYDFVPPALDDLLDGQKAEVRKRWLRENVAVIAAIHEQEEQALLEVETKVAIQTRKSDKAIARLRRQLRFLPSDDPGRALLAEAIAEEEDWQDRVIDWLGQRLEELRRHYDTLERKASKGLRPRIEVDTLYLINWHHRSAPTSDVLSAWAEVVRDTREVHRRGSHPLDISDKQIKALAELARAPGWVERKGEFIPRSTEPPPVPPKPPPRRIEIDWTAMGGVPNKATDTKTKGDVRDVQGRAAPTSAPAAFPTSPPLTPTPAPSSNGEDERAALLERLRQLEIQGQKFRQGSPKMHRNQIARIEISRKIAALDRRSDPMASSPPASSERRTKQDLLDEMLRRAAARADGSEPL